MVRMPVRHRVADYRTWREACEAFDRASLGVKADAVYQQLDDPDDVTVWHDFDTRGQAESFMGSDELKSTMTKAGVQGAPNIWVTAEA